MLGFKPKRTNLHEKYDYPHCSEVIAGLLPPIFPRAGELTDRPSERVDGYPPTAAHFAVRHHEGSAGGAWSRAPPDTGHLETEPTAAPLGPSWLAFSALAKQLGKGRL
jgi:hypothetical protein